VRSTSGTKQTYKSSKSSELAPIGKLANELKLPVQLSTVSGKHKQYKSSHTRTTSSISYGEIQNNDEDQVGNEQSIKPTRLVKIEFVLSKKNIEKILDKQIHGRKVEYLIQWNDLSNSTPLISDPSKSPKQQNFNTLTLFGFKSLKWQTNIYYFLMLGCTTK